MYKKVVLLLVAVFFTLACNHHESDHKNSISNEVNSDCKTEEKGEECHCHDKD